MVPMYLADTEFDVAHGDLSSLEIRDSGKSGGFHYFFDTKSNRLIKDFRIDERPQVDTFCCVTLIKKEDHYSPRLRFWKKDKTKRGKKILQRDMTAPTEQSWVMKASVDTGDAHENFWKLIQFLESFSQVSLPDYDFRVVTNDSAELARTLEGQDRQVVLEAVRLAVGGDGLTEDDIRLLGNRREQLRVFHRLLSDNDYFEDKRVRWEKKRQEDVWQHFFESNPWIFGYGLQLIACEPLDENRLEQITSGANIFTGGGKRADAVMRSRGYVSSLLFCEIKTHRTPLLARQPYREPDVYQVSAEISGAISQVQKTVSKALAVVSLQFHRMYKSDGTPTGIQVSTVRPRQAVVIGSLGEFMANGEINPEKSSSFELYRNSISDVEIITFDELYERARFIVRDD